MASIMGEYLPSPLPLKKRAEIEKRAEEIRAWQREQYAREVEERVRRILYVDAALQRARTERIRQRLLAKMY